MAANQTWAGSKMAVPFGNVDFTTKEFEKLAGNVLQYTPPEECGVERINILLMGGVGSGKSSFTSSIDSIFQKRISRRAPSGQGTGSLTQRLRKFDFKIKGQSSNFTVWDTPGWTKNEYRDGVMNLLLNGSIRDRTDIAKALPTAPTYKEDSIKADAGFEDAVHVLAFVVPCEAVSDEEYLGKLLELKEYARVRGTLPDFLICVAGISPSSTLEAGIGYMPVIIFLTKIDEYDPGLLADLTATFHSQRIFDTVQALALKAGVPRNSIVPVKNYSTEYEPGVAAGILILRGVYEALNSATDYLREAADGSDFDSAGEFKKLKGPREKFLSTKGEDQRLRSNLSEVRAKADYTPDDPEEYLSLRKGRVYWQLSAAEDGWVQGCAVSDPHKEGLFPQAFVEPARRPPAPSL